MRPVTKISCGLKHCLVLTSNDKLFAWGSNLQCQLGRRLVAASQGGQGSNQVLAFSNVPVEVTAYEKSAVKRTSTVVAPAAAAARSSRGSGLLILMAWQRHVSRPCGPPFDLCVPRGCPRVETQPVGRARWPSAEAFQAVKSCALEMRLRTRETRPRTLSVV